MYFEGLGFHSITRLLGVGHASVINWVKKYDNQLIGIRNPRLCRLMELDEMHSYIGTTSVALNIFIGSLLFRE